VTTDIVTRDLIRMNLVAEEMGVSFNTVCRYRLTGCRGVKLRAVLIGGVWKSHRKWVAEFLEAINNPTATAPASQSGRAATDADAKADAEVADVKALLKMK